MATEKLVTDTRAAADAILALPMDKLLERPEWGTITFKQAQPHIERARSVAGDVRILPVELLKDDILTRIKVLLDEILVILNGINTFNLQQGNPTDVRNSLASQIESKSWEIFTYAYAWIAFLAYQKGDVNKNIDEITQAVAQGKQLVSDASAAIAAKRTEIDEIVVAAREAAATAGIAHFTQDFAEESVRLRTYP